eukprot:scaffold64581_cov69-Phaeocystis_antarctica.AAC.1
MRFPVNSRSDIKPEALRNCSVGVCNDIKLVKRRPCTRKSTRHWPLPLKFVLHVVLALALDRQRQRHRPPAPLPARRRPPPLPPPPPPPASSAAVGTLAWRRRPRAPPRQRVHASHRPIVTASTSSTESALPAAEPHAAQRGGAGPEADGGGRGHGRSVPVRGGPPKVRASPRRPSTVSSCACRWARAARRSRSAA